MSETTELPAAARPALSAWMTWLLAGACGLIAANIYYAQPLVGPIAASLGMDVAAAGLIVTVTQLGYGAGLLLLVPLADRIENRRLALSVLALSAIGLLGCSLTGSAGGFLAASLLVGVGSVTVQILVPWAAHLAPEAVRGRVVGNVMSGLMLGIMLARPFSSFIAGFGSWRLVFTLSCGLMLLLALLLRRALPVRPVAARLSYGALLASMGRLALTTPVLQRRALYHAAMFAAFSLFWTTIPLRLAAEFGLSQNGIALFALAGVAGAVAAPLAGRLADRRHIRRGTWLALGGGIAAFALTFCGGHGSALAIGALVAAAMLLDFAVSAHLVLGQRVIFALDPALRGRLNGLYMATFFCGGALGSALGAWLYATAGWEAASWLGMALPAAALIGFSRER